MFGNTNETLTLVFEMLLNMIIIFSLCCYANFAIMFLLCCCVVHAGDKNIIELDVFSFAIAIPCSNVFMNGASVNRASLFSYYN